MAGDEPGPERVRGAGRRQGGDRGRVQHARRAPPRVREVRRPERVQQRGRLLRPPREPREGLRGPRPALRDRREHPMPHVVPVVRVRRVPGVLDPREPALLRVGEDLRARDREERPHQPQAAQRGLPPHARHPGRPRPPQDAEQRGLRLVVAVVGEQDRLAGRNRLGDRAVAGRAGRGFEIPAARGRPHDGAAGLEPDPEPRRRRPAVVLPGARVRVEAVVDVHRGQTLRRPAAERPGRRVEEDGRVEPAAEGDPPPSGCEGRLAGRPPGGSAGGPCAQRRAHRLEDEAPLRRRRHGPSGARSGAR